MTGLFTGKEMKLGSQRGRQVATSGEGLVLLCNMAGAGECACTERGLVQGAKPPLGTPASHTTVPS